MSIKVLHLQGNAVDDAIIEDSLNSYGIDHDQFKAIDQASLFDVLQNRQPDIILLHDHCPGELTPLDTLTILAELKPAIPFVVVNCSASTDLTLRAVEIMKLGAYDYLTKDSVHKLREALTAACEKHRSIKIANPEGKLKESEQRFRELLENSGDMIMISDGKGDITYLSPNLTKLLGYEPQDFTASNIGRKFTHPEDKKAYYEVYFDSRRNPGKSISIVGRFRHGAGFWIWIEVEVINLLHIPSVNGIVSNFRDVTVRKLAEDALKRSEANLSAIIENTTDLVYSLDRELRFITFNQLFKTTIKQVYGFDVAQGVNTLNMLAGFDAEVAKKWRDIYSRALAGEAIQFVNEYNFHDTRIWLSYSVNPIRETGEVIGLSCFSRDITQQKIDEEALKRSEANLRTIFNNTDMAIVLVDPENKIVQFNNLAERFAEEQYGLIIKKGDSVLDQVSEGRREHLLATLAKVKDGEFVNYQISREVDGASKWFDITWAGIKNNNEYLGYIFTNKDITEKKKSEIEREKITADLTQRNKDLEQFTYIISHNLRAPVANIMGLSSLLSELKDVENGYADIIEGIAISANKLDEVILDLNQILQVSKSNEKVEKILLTSLIVDIQQSINNLIEKENVKIQCDFSDGNSIFTLKSYLYSVFYNLILNSIKYHKPGVSPIVNISSKTLDSKIKISYLDNGRGIDMVKNARSIFGLYKRFDTSVEGKGMGLFMVKMQVESLGGTITVQSKLNEGTCFELEFPVNRSYETLVR